MSTEKSNALVLGASGGLAQALIAQFLADTTIDTVIAVSSKPAPVSVQAESSLLWIHTEYQEPAMHEVVEKLKDYSGTISRVCICHALLHTDSLWPEKRLEDIKPEALHEIFQANAVVPALWLKLLHKVLKGKQPAVVAALSARVGSIGDNRLGGWYAYRSSKSALNMLLQNIAIEYARRVKNVKLISFHPGTTDTALSKPFQATVPEGKLFTAEFVAERLTGIMDNAVVDGQLSYLDWDNKVIPW
jgi:NAD(P)-dependent dehydrogenase (short-subunit alcohol dehydrogenase family)